MIPKPRESVRLQSLHHELLVRALSTAFGSIEHELLEELTDVAESVIVRRGEALFRQGEPSDALYVVVNGRFQIVRNDDRGNEEFVAEVGQGECIGEMGLLSGLARNATPFAIRDSVLCRIPASRLETILVRSPRSMMTITREVTRRLLGATKRKSTMACTHIAVVPVRPDAPSAYIASAMIEHLNRIGPTLHLTAKDVVQQVGREALEKENHHRWHEFSTWIEEQSCDYRFIVLEGDATAKIWFRRALAEADSVLLVADASSDPWMHSLEREMLGEKADPRTARRTLVLVHPADCKVPRGTAKWLSYRTVEQHLHVRNGRDADIARVARTMAGAAVSLVLGAGGARGFAHVGTLQALEEAGISIDSIGGVSCGAFVAGLYSMGQSTQEMMSFGRSIIEKRPFGDYALPVTSVLQGRRVEQLAETAFGEVAIEDLWLPYFCTACDISVFRDVVFDRGSLAVACLASSALPGILPPRIHQGHLLVDGGTTDVLPGSVMRLRSTGPMIAVDVSTERELVDSRERYPTSWAALMERIRPSVSTTLSLPELFMRAVSFGVAQRTAAVAQDADLFLRPPVEGFGTLEIRSMSIIADLGYKHARDRIAQTWPAIVSTRSDGVVRIDHHA